MTCTLQGVKWRQTRDCITQDFSDRPKESVNIYRIHFTGYQIFAYLVHILVYFVGFSDQGEFLD